MCDRCCVTHCSDCRDTSPDVYTTRLRLHDDCSPYVARWPMDPDALGPLGGTYDLVYSEERQSAAGLAGGGRQQFREEAGWTNPLKLRIAEAPRESHRMSYIGLCQNIGCLLFSAQGSFLVSVSGCGSTVSPGCCSKGHGNFVSLCLS